MRAAAVTATILPDMPDLPRHWWRDWRLLLALGGGSGIFPRAPGTAATALAWALYQAAALLPLPALAALVVVMLAAGAPLCNHAERALRCKDDGRIVWDEIAAFFAVLLLLPAAWQWQAAGFALFRLLDSAKPFPISWLDKNIKGGIGIMLDDIAAAAVTLALLHLARLLGVVVFPA